MNTTALSLLLMIISTCATSSPLDEKLQTYIKEFNMQALEWPAESTKEEVELGAQLFFERDLSGNRNMTCAGCHSLQLGLGDGIPLSIGQGMKFIGSTRVLGNGALLNRNAPHVFNIGFDEQVTMFWDGRISYDESADTFETPNTNLNGYNPKRSDIKTPLTHANSAQALFPMLSHEEMLGSPGENEIAGLSSDEKKWEALLNRLLFGPNASFYQKRFKAAFPSVEPGDITIGHVAEAIYAFQKHAYVINDTNWDNYLRGDRLAMGPAQKRGALVFMEKGRCANCHNGPHLSDFDFKNIAIPPIGPGVTENNQDYGRFHVTGNEEDKFKFKTPALRNVALTAPYMHNGAFLRLEEVVDHYNHVRHSFMHYSTKDINRKFRLTYEGDIERVFIRNEVIDMFEKLDQDVWPPLFLSKQERDDLLVFLKEALTQQRPSFYKPW